MHSSGMVCRYPSPPEGKRPIYAFGSQQGQKGVLALAHEGQKVQSPEDVVKSTYTLEFLGLEDRKRYKERDLEERLIDNMQMFLLELGKGFYVCKETVSSNHQQYPLSY